MENKPIMKYPEDFINKIICSDCIEVMRGMKENSIDTIITDPPYGIGFMGKEWDTFKEETLQKVGKGYKEKKRATAEHKNGTQGINSRAAIAGLYNQSLEGHIDYQKWFTEIAKELLRVTKPGGTMLIFGGTRTYHRLACAIEDAGWILKDCIMWLYGSGFPKATDISKQLDKGVERKVVGKYKSSRPEKPTGSWQIDDRSEGKGTGFKGGEMKITKPSTSEAKLWNGWKSHGLKPAVEPILSCLKPLTIEQYFAILVEDITNSAKILCQTLNVKDAEKTFSDIQAKLKKGLECIVVENVKINLWESIENVRFVESNSISKEQDLITQNIKEGFVPLNVKESGKQDIIKKTISLQQKMEDIGEKKIQLGEAESMLIKIMDISTSATMENMSLNTALLWKNILEELLKEAKQYTTKTAINLIMGLRILKLSLTPTTSKNTGNLRPNYEPILVAMKSNEGSYAQNALKHGVSGLNIDGGRIGYKDKEDWDNTLKSNTGNKAGGTFKCSSKKLAKEEVITNKGRFPANIILECICDELIEGKASGSQGHWAKTKVTGYGKTTDYRGVGEKDNMKCLIHTNPECPAKLLDEQSGELKSPKTYKRNTKVTGNINWNPKEAGTMQIGIGDKGGASRFFYVAKASREERNMGCEGNNHPTVKPLKLMEYLRELTKTPTGGIVLDPFGGSGTTGMAAKKTKRDYILIEKEPEYCKIAEARIKAQQEPLL